MQEFYDKPGLNYKNILAFPLCVKTWRKNSIFNIAEVTLGM